MKKKLLCVMTGLVLALSAGIFVSCDDDESATLEAPTIRVDAALYYYTVDYGTVDDSPYYQNWYYVGFSWGAQDNVVGYYIYRKVAGADDSTKEYVSATGTNYYIGWLDTVTAGDDGETSVGGLDGRTYVYIIAALNAFGYPDASTTTGKVTLSSDSAIQKDSYTEIQDAILGKD